MLHFKTKTEILLDSLKARKNQIKSVAGPLYHQDPKVRRYLNLYREISLYIHNIMLHMETRSLFVSLVNYKKSILKDSKFLELLSRIEENVAAVSTKMLSHPEYEKLLSSPNYNFANPMLSFSTPSLPIEDLLKQLQKFKFSDGNDDAYLDRTSGVLEKVLAECSNLGMKDLDPILHDLNSLHALGNEFKYYTDFQSDYVGSASAYRLSLIYAGFNPIMNFDETTDQTFLLDNISEGRVMVESENLEVLMNDCDKIFHYLKQQLNSQNSIESYIDRFTTYVSLYYDSDFSLNTAEVDLQKKFQEFIFNAGYYPISEAQLNDGRLDTIAVNESAAFLFEVKQFDLAGTKESNKSLIGKISAAQVQASIYVERLKTYPRLSNFVFILLFTNRKISFKDGIDRIRKDGISYIVKPVSMYSQTPSSVKLDVEIGINDLINYA